MKFLLATLVSMQALWGAQKAPPTPDASYNIDGTINGYRPPFYPEKERSFFLTADFLYLQSTIDGFVFAWSFPETILGSNFRPNPIPNGVFHDIDYDWAPGVRLGIGHHLPLDNWDLHLSWTYFQNHCDGHAHVGALSGNSLISLWAPAAYIAASFDAQGGQAQWQLTYNTVDLTLGRTSFATRTVVVSPFLGVRGAFIHQHFKAHYTNGVYILSDDSATPSSIQFKGSNLFNGWGIRPGLETSWMLTKNWSFYAHSSLSALFGHFSLREGAHFASAPTNNLLDESDGYYRNAYAFDLAAGVKWEMFFGASCRRHILVSVGYEMASWIAQNQMVNFTYIDQVPGFGPYLSGDLGLQGIDISARFDF